MESNKKDSEKVIIGWKIPKKLKIDLQKLALKDEKPVQVLTAEILAKYVQVHKSGNPIFSLDKYLDPDFRATPAFLENFNQVWIHHFQISSNDNLDELIAQARKIMTYASAYRNVNPDQRSITGFGTLRDAEAKAKF